MAIARAMIAPRPQASPRAKTVAAADNDPLCPPENNQHRYERKYRMEGISLAAIELWLRRHPALFRPIHHERWLNNIYFDTQDLRAVWENLGGVARRIKTRVRWYGDLLGPINAPVIERKIREGMVGRKRIFVLPPFEMGPGVSTDAALAAIEAADLPQAIRLDVSLMRPVLMNRYCRRYFQSADGRFRITVDWNMEFYPLCGPANGLLKRHMLRNAAVLELKYAPQDDAGATMIGDHLPLRSTRNSKYVIGMQLCYPLPHVQD